MKVFDLGAIEIIGQCDCRVGYDHKDVRYKLYKLDIFPQLQLAIAGWPIIGKQIRSFSWTLIKSKLENPDDENIVI